jgi:hypothetical protein
MNAAPGCGMIDAPFQGYPAPSSNTTYCPNQFFDVVLPHSSRGVVRLVGYMLRRVLGWSDADGRPQEPTVTFSWSELEKNAGIGNSAIRAALDAASAARFLRCLRPGRAHAPGQVAVPARYELRWDDRGEYLTDPNAFQGFYAGNGNLTYIPNAFFDHTLKTEPLAVIRVVGAILRNTIGWQTHYGLRRQRIAMSFTELQRRTQLSRQALNEALQQAIAHQHLLRLEAGYFDPEAGRTSRAATYGLKWRDSGPAASSPPLTGEQVPLREPAPAGVSVRKADRRVTGDRSENWTGQRSENWTGGSVQNLDRERSETVTGERSEKQTGLEITDPNNTPEKQQQPSRGSPPSLAAVGVPGGEEQPAVAISLLRAQGFDPETAARLAAQHPVAQIWRQCEWLPRRRAQKNRLGLLRRAIEQDWPEPPPAGDAIAPVASPPTPSLTPAAVFATYAYAGLAGNPGPPQAVPSAADLQATVPFVGQLLAACPDEGRIAVWGRQFGSYVKQAVDRTGGAVLPRSMALALRVYGDGFYRDFQRKQESERRQTQAERRQAHQERWAGAYAAYLGECRTRLAAGYPDLWEQFRAHEQAQRAPLAGVLPETSPLRAKALASFDADREQLGRMAEFFQAEAPFPVFTFWAWDAALNPERLKGRAA